MPWVSLKFAEFNNSIWVEFSFHHDIHHKQYFLISVPDDVLHFIEENHWLPMKDVCSNPNFKFS